MFGSKLMHMICNEQQRNLKDRVFFPHKDENGLHVAHSSDVINGACLPSVVKEK